MSNLIDGSTFNPGDDNNYIIAGNITNSFAMGSIGSVDNFFIMGIEPNRESSHPLISGNILDSEGNVLFRIVRNVFVFNPNNLHKIKGDGLGYEIRDSLDELILKVDTKFEYNELLSRESYITRITANFYDQEGNLVFEDVAEKRNAAVYGFGWGVLSYDLNHDTRQDLLIAQITLDFLECVYQDCLTCIRVDYCNKKQMVCLSL